MIRLNLLHPAANVQSGDEWKIESLKSELMTRAIDALSKAGFVNLDPDYIDHERCAFMIPDMDSVEAAKKALGEANIASYVDGEPVIQIVEIASVQKEVVDEFMSVGETMRVAVAEEKLHEVGILVTIKAIDDALPKIVNSLKNLLTIAGAKWEDFPTHNGHVFKGKISFQKEQTI